MRDPSCFFVTKSLQPRRKAISSDTARIISAAWTFYAEKGNVYLAAFVVMLDHWHVLFAPALDTTLAAQMQRAGRWIGRQTKEAVGRRGCRWQDGYHDTRIRSSKQFLFVRNYIETNPIKAGLVESPEDWPWSSASPNYRERLTDPWPWTFEQDRA
ncbi:MAG TPA: transposase [Sumerlaeia bacterium]|nr:transposase [Sumerlaeia bacterium]